jgi:hypothetical protein
MELEPIKPGFLTGSAKSLGFAQKIVYYCKETIGYFLGKANAEGNKLCSLAPSESAKEENQPEDTQDKSEEEK